MKKYYALVLVFAVLVSLLAGCGVSGSTGSSTTGTTVAASTTSQVTEAPSTTAKPKEASITWFFKASNAQLPDDGYVVKKIKQDLNIDFKHLAPKTNNYNESLNLLIAAGTVPDIITTPADGILTNTLVSDGVALPVEKYLNKDTVPNLIRIQKNWDTAIKYVTYPDGHIYAIPDTNKNNETDCMWIRYDWLKNLNLPVPTTFDELKDTLIAFTKDDPNKDGKNDTVGTMINQTWSPMDWAEMMGSDVYDWYDKGDGTITLGRFLPRHKDFLTYMKSLIDTGALDKETLTTTFDQVVQKTQAGKVGFVFNWLDYSTNAAIQKIQPDADMRPMPPIKSIYDKGYDPAGTLLHDEDVITTSCKDVDAVFRLINYMCDDQSTKDNYDFTGTYWPMKFGQPNVNWKIVNGNIETGANDPAIQAQNKIDNWAAVWFRFQDQFDYAFRANLPDFAKQCYAAIDSYPTTVDIPAGPNKPVDMEGIIVPDSVSKFITGNDTKWAEMYSKAILGQGNIDDLWNAYIADANKNGLSDVEKTMTQLAQEHGRLK